MKSNVKAGLALDIARMRVRVFGALGVGGALASGCKTSSDAGLVMAPMAETASSTSVAAATLDAGVDSGAHRPTVEPRAPNGQTCTREVHCVQTLAQAPTFPFSPPYEKCDPAPLGETGHFSPMETASHRSEEPNTCCYVSFVACSRRGRGNVRPHVMIGRPLRDARGDAIVAGVVASNGWARCTEDASHDEARAAYWLEGAAAEHASVAEFARISLTLLALGAPAELVADVHRAALDEIAHAEACFSIASRLSGRALGPGPLDVARGTTSSSIEDLVACTLRDGCLGETAASIELAAMARDPENAPFADAIAKMADDEARHAELAWRIVAFALERDRDAALRAVEKTELGGKSEVEARVLMEIVRPMLNALVTPRSPREGDCARGA